MRNNNHGSYIKGLGKGADFTLSLFMLILSTLMVLPLILIFAISFSSESSIAENGYRFWPTKWSLEAYSYIFNNSGNLLRAFGVTFIVTATGTLLSLMLISTMAYVLSNKTYKNRKLLNRFVLIPMFFGGGLAAIYAVNTQLFNLKNNILALILPVACSSWYIIVMRTYFSNNIPGEVLEAARLDGANTFRLYLQFVLPLSKPILLTVGVFEAFSYWNSWYENLIYTDSRYSNLYTLQYILYNMEKNASAITANEYVSGGVTANIPTESLRMALACIIIVPVILIYPFFRKLFVRGLTGGTHR